MINTKEKDTRPINERDKRPKGEGRLKNLPTISSASPRLQKAWAAFLKTMEEDGSVKTWREILDAAGYSQQTKPIQVYGTDAWQQALAQIDDTPIIRKWVQWATDDDEKTRGYAIKAGENLLKLKRRYPENQTIRRSKIVELYEEEDEEDNYAPTDPPTHQKITEDVTEDVTDQHDE